MHSRLLHLFEGATKRMRNGKVRSFSSHPPFVHVSWCTWWTRTHLNTRRVRMGWKVSFRLLDKKDNLSRYRERWMHIILLFINFCITGIWSTLKKVYLSGKSFFKGWNSGNWKKYLTHLLLFPLSKSDMFIIF